MFHSQELGESDQNGSVKELDHQVAGKWLD